MAAAPPVDYSRLKILSILEGPAAAVLLFVLKHGTNAPSKPISLEQYLKTLPHGSTANYCSLSDKDKKKTFNNTEITQINADPSWNTFDVSLLYKSIRLACENLAGLNDNVVWGDATTLEGLMREIKEQRNKFVRETSVNKKGV